VASEHNDKKMESVYSKRIRAGKRRTYFFDVRETKGNDYYLTITESRKRFNDDGYDRHKIFLYKEDFNKFLKGITEAIDFVKTELMPDFDFDAFNHDNPEHFEEGSREDHSAPVKREEPVDHSEPIEPAEPREIVAEATTQETEETPPTSSTPHEDVDKW